MSDKYFWEHAPTSLPVSELHFPHLWWVYSPLFFISARLKCGGFEDFNCGWRNSEPWLQPTRHSSLLPPAWVWPLTLSWPVAFRHPLRRPLMWCLLECTVGLITHLERAAWNSIQWVCWPVLSEGSKGGLEIKGEAVCEVNSREQYFTCAAFSQRMLMSVRVLIYGFDWVTASGRTESQQIINFPCFGDILHYPCGDALVTEPKVMPCRMSNMHILTFLEA